MYWMKMTFVKRFLQISKTISFKTFFLLAMLFFIIINKHAVLKEKRLLEQNSETLKKIYPSALNYERKDWRDWKFFEYEKTLEGPGEQGREFILTDPDDIARNEKIFKDNGLYGVVSDIISVNRSIPDTRPKK